MLSTEQVELCRTDADTDADRSIPCLMACFLLLHNHDTHYFQYFYRANMFRIFFIQNYLLLLINLQPMSTEIVLPLNIAFLNGCHSEIKSVTGFIKKTHLF